MGALEPDRLTEQERPASPVHPFLEYMEGQFGRVDPLALHEIATSMPAITIHVVRTLEKQILFTTGMSDRSMNVPEGADQFRFAELVLNLPLGWPLSDEALNDPRNYWPIEWLRRVAHYPHLNNTWLGTAAIIANDEPPQALAPNTLMTCILAIQEPDVLAHAELRDGRHVAVYTLQPLYTEERDLERDHGISTLLQLMELAGISKVVDVNRPNVAPRRL